MNRIYVIFLTIVWVSVIAKITKADCPPPPVRSNVEAKYPQNVNARRFKEFTTISFSCKRGFRRSDGHQTAICVGNGWQTNEGGEIRSFLPLTCTEKICPVKKLAHGNSLVINKTITYKCDRGYRLRGRNVANCRLNKKDDYYVVGPLPQCIKLNECEAPQDENILVHGDCCYAGDRTRFSCASRYRMEGTSSSLCKNDGNWTKAVPTCNFIRQCEDPENIINGYRTGDCCEIGSALKYTCDNEYEFIDTNQKNILTCLPTLEWSSQKPKCKPSGSLTCPDIPFAENNLVLLSEHESDVFLPDNEVELDCIPYYTTNAETTSLRCTEDGEWDADIPECIPLTPCKRPPPIQHGKIIELIDNPAAVFPVNFEINIECDENYELKSTHYGSRCLGDDVWDNRISNCTLIDCKDPGVPPNAIRHGDEFYIGNNVSYSCVGNMDLIGSSTRTCLDTKRWSGFTPVCDSGTTDCHDPGVPLNSQRIGNGFNVGDVVNYTCPKNHILMGSPTRVCTDSGGWTGSEVICLAPDEYSDKEEVALELEGTMTEVARMSTSSISMISMVRAGGVSSADMKGVNVYFLFDASGSITRDQFDQSKELAKNLIRKVGISSSAGGVRVGIIVFSKQPIVKVYPAVDTNLNAVLDKIDKMERQAQGTNIAAALEKLLETVATTKRHPDRQNCEDVLFLMTDGNANEGGQPTSQAEELNRLKVKVYVISIGDKAHEETLLLITNKKPKHIIKLKNHKALFDLLATLVTGKLDFSACGLERATLIRTDVKASGSKNRRKRSVTFGRIVGGEAAKFAWPWMAALYKKNLTGKAFTCGGSIIHSRWILSAAHCFVIVQNDMIKEIETENNLVPTKWIVSVGRVHLENDDSGLNAYVEKIIRHEHYNPLTHGNDIALIQLKVNLHYDIFTQPICLPPPIQELSELYVPKKNAMVIGWGYTGVDYLNVTTKPHSEILKELTLPLQPPSTCHKPNKYNCGTRGQYAECNKMPADNSFCAGTGLGGTDTCQGDSGGPFMQFVKSNSSGTIVQRWFQVGIVSWGVGCAMTGYYGYYTHVAKLRDWIVNTTGISDFEESIPIGS